jgi:hypothetical protein
MCAALVNGGMSVHCQGSGCSRICFPPSPKLLQPALQEKNRELQEQVQFLESQRLQHWEGAQASPSPAKRSVHSPTQHEAATGSRRFGANGSQAGPAAGDSPCQLRRPAEAAIPARRQLALNSQAMPSHAATNQFQQQLEVDDAACQGEGAADQSDLEFEDDG